MSGASGDRLAVVVVDGPEEASTESGDRRALIKSLSMLASVQIRVVSPRERSSSMLADLVDPDDGNSWNSYPGLAVNRLAWRAVQLAEELDADFIVGFGWELGLSLSGNSRWASRVVLGLVVDDIVPLITPGNTSRIAEVVSYCAGVFGSAEVGSVLGGRLGLSLDCFYDVDNGASARRQASWELFAAPMSATWLHMMLIDAHGGLCILDDPAADGTSLKHEQVALRARRVVSIAGAVTAIVGARDEPLEILSNLREFHGRPENVRRTAWNLLELSKAFPLKLIATANVDLLRYAVTHPELAAYMVYRVSGEVVAGGEGVDNRDVAMGLASSVPVLADDPDVAGWLSSRFGVDGDRVAVRQRGGVESASGFITMAARWGVVRRSGRDSRKPARVVVAGHDLKFARHLIRQLLLDQQYEVIVDRWPGQHDPGSKDREVLADWADVVWVEFASSAAAYYSRIARDRFRLIVRVHGYEVRGAWAEEIDIPAVDKFVYVSDHLQFAGDERWNVPRESSIVIPNAIDSDFLDEAKADGARYVLGVLGWTPGLKRIDRALQLLRLLRQTDERYHLVIKGELPRDASWFLSERPELDLFQRFLEDLRLDSDLAGAVSFEEADSSVNSWLRSVGWLLSLSDRESFHLAPIEGMASRAVPLVLRREGVNSIFPSEFIFESVEDISSFVLAIVESNGFSDAGERAREASLRFDVTRVGRNWKDLILGRGANFFA